MTGTTTRLSKVERNIPPMMTQPMPFLSSALDPEASATGIMPMIVESAVIRIGRVRIRTAPINASSTESPAASCSFAKSTKRMAFLATNPISMTIPSIAKRSSEEPDKARARMAPSIEKGIESITTRGSIHPLYSTTRARYINTIDKSIAMPITRMESDIAFKFPMLSIVTPELRALPDTSERKRLEAAPGEIPTTFELIVTEGFRL